MIHARNDYNRIQDPEGKIAEDEPVFLLRAKDSISPFVVEFWAKRLRLSGGDVEMTRMAEFQADRMREWQKRNGCKLPDL